MSISKTQTVEDLAHINALLESFKLLYNTLNANTYDDGLIDKVYADDIEFIDCFHHINGIQNFKKYCASIYENVKHCQFEFHDEYIKSNSAMLTWTMEYTHPKLNNGKMIYVKGSSEILFNKKVYKHKDYVDSGELLYEHIPLLKTVISFLKKRMM
ncbi:nuclear transport factor 2 family protein [Oceaniserpentilla sp. 4NH20-0058]|uniref:nuclear transport factor 2 family protein n=1 Tax=Oceaniserpentilla sp. 4NH20-0058 TaxID=3127660 RepID=UPI00310525BA